MKDRNEAQIPKLIQLAMDHGATGAEEVETARITVREELANICVDPGCPNYGTSANCPPTSAGAEVFRKLLEGYVRAIVMKIDVPRDVLMSSDRQDVFRLLHDTAAGVEIEAKKSGFPHARAFVSGGCKELFCHDHADCRALSDGGECRNPDRSRPSMSGYGVDVGLLVKLVGWELNTPVVDGSGSISAIVGLILLD